MTGFGLERFSPILGLSELRLRGQPVDKALRELLLKAMKEKLPPFLTPKDLATLLQVSQETVRRMARRGELPHVHGIRVLRFSREAVLSLLYSNEPPEGPR